MIQLLANVQGIVKGLLNGDIEPEFNAVGDKIDRKEKKNNGG